jgi:hypothetical protein
MHENLDDIKGPMMREIMNCRRENEGFVNELKRAQGFNREIVSDYFKLMDTKIKGNEEVFLSKSQLQLYLSLYFK